MQITSLAPHQQKHRVTACLMRFAEQKWSCGARRDAKPHLIAELESEACADRSVCVCTQKALFVFFSVTKLPCGLFCCLFFPVRSGSHVWTVRRETRSTREFRSRLRWALCRLWSRDGTLNRVPRWDLGEQVIALSWSLFCSLLRSVAGDDVRLMHTTKLFTIQGTV